MTTVGDQIFDLTSKLQILERQCQRFEAALRTIVAENPCESPSTHACPTCHAKNALAVAGAGDAAL